MIDNETLLRAMAPLLGAALGAAFGAGGAVWQMRRWVRDINNIGRKLTRTIAMLNRWADSEEKRNQIADLIDGK